MASNFRFVEFEALRNWILLLFQTDSTQFRHQKETKWPNGIIWFCVSIDANNSFVCWDVNLVAQRKATLTRTAFIFKPTTEFQMQIHNTIILIWLNLTISCSVYLCKSSFCGVQRIPICILFVTFVYVLLSVLELQFNSTHGIPTFTFRSLNSNFGETGIQEVTHFPIKLNVVRVIIMIVCHPST